MAPKATREDLMAAGLSASEAATALPSRAKDETFIPREEDSVQEYDDKRGELRSKTTNLLSSLGFSEEVSKNFATSLAGTEREMGLVDLTPLGLPLGISEGIAQYKRGKAGNSKTDMAMGVANAGLNALSAVPGGVVAGKGVKALSDKLMKSYDPSVVRSVPSGNKNMPDEALVEYNKAVRVRKGLLDRDTVNAGDNILYRPDRAYRFIGSRGFEDFTSSGVIRAKESSKQSYEAPYFMKGKSSSRYGGGESGDYLVETVPSKDWGSAGGTRSESDYITPPKNLSAEDQIRIFKRDEDGSFSVIFDNIGDEALLATTPKFSEGGLVASKENYKDFKTPLNLMFADPKKDKFVSRDELGNDMFETPEGTRYTMGDIKRPDSLPETAKKVVGNIPPMEDWRLPTGGEVVSGAKAVAEGAYDVVKSATDPDATLGNMFDIAGSASLPTVASRVGTPLDASVVSAMGATHRVPRYPNNPKKGFLDRIFSGENNKKAPTQFMDPLFEIINELEVPKKGLSGSQFLKELQDNPTIRNAQIKSEGIADRIDPSKRYTKEELGKLFGVTGRNSEPSLAGVGRDNQFQNFQRQFDLVDEEVGYIELPVDAFAGSKNFDANDQHYNKNTLSHTRLSERKSKGGNYILVEELQSDLLQQGFLKPASRDAAVKDFFSERSLKREFPYDAEAFEIARQITPEVMDKFLKAADTLEERQIGKDFTTNVLQKPSGNYETLQVLNQAAKKIRRAGNPNLKVPPIAKTEEGVALGLFAAIGEADSRGLSKIVIPPLHKIVEKRFDNPVDRAKAMDPNSGFYQTYVTGVDRFIADLKGEFGDKVQTREFDLKYDGNKKENNFSQVDGDDFNDTLPEDFIATPRDIFDGDFQDTFYEAFWEVSGTELPGGLGRQAVARYETSIRRFYGDAPVTEALTDTDEAIARAVEKTLDKFNITGNAHDLIHDNIADGMSFEEAYKIAVGPAPKKAPNLVSEKGIEINFEGLRGQNLNLQKPRFAEGGVVMNPVPPGALPQEVADDVDVKLSEGEYVVPANVVRFLGLDKLEKMVSQANMKLEEMSSAGRMGNEPDEELPFAMEELMSVEDAPQASPAQAPQMAVGGLVPAAPTTPTSTSGSMTLDPLTGLPKWMVAGSTAPVAPRGFMGQQNEDARDGVGDGGTTQVSGMAGSLDQWTPENYTKYGTARNSMEQKFGQSLVSVIPGGNLMAKSRERYLERNVPKKIDDMLKAGVDLQGNVLTPEQITGMEATKATMRSTPLDSFGKSGVARQLAEKAGIVSPRSSTKQAALLEKQQSAVQKDSLINRAIDFLTREPVSTSPKSQSSSTTSRTSSTPTREGRGDSNSAPTSSVRPNNRSNPPSKSSASTSKSSSKSPSSSKSSSSGGSGKSYSRAI